MVLILKLIASHQNLKAPALDESKSNQVASTPPADPKLNIQQQEEIASAREVSEETAPILMSTEASGISNALFAEEEINHSSDEDVDPDTPLKSCTTTDHPSETNTVLNFVVFFTSKLLAFFSHLLGAMCFHRFCYSTDFCLFF